MVAMISALFPHPPVNEPALRPVDFEARVGPSVAGWFGPTDVRAFRAIDELHGTTGTSGDILEIGAFAGRSAILLGSLLRGGETLVVNDLWDDLPFEPGAWDCIDRPAQPGRVRGSTTCGSMRTCPGVVVGSSTTALDGEVGDSTCRFVHVDGSHERSIVTVDVATARRTCRPGGIMVFDDHMNPRHPDVAAAVWGAVDRGELRPVVVTTSKLYAVAPVDRAGARRAGVLGDRPRARRRAPRKCCGHDALRFELPAHRGSAWIPPALKPTLRSVRRAVRRRPRRAG